MRSNKALAWLLTSACVLASLAAIAGGKSTATTTTLSGTPNPANINQQVMLTANVSPAISAGTVTFKDGTATLGTGTVVNGVAKLPTAFTTSGTHSITAAYSGTTGYGASTSSAFGETVTTTVMPASTVTLTSNNNPEPIYGYITLTANVSPAAATGTVSFMNGGTTLGTATVVNGVASIGSVYFNSAGTYNLTAVYSGDATYAGSASSALAENITTIPTTTRIDLPLGQFVSIGQTVAITGAVQNQWSSGLSGTMTLYDGTTQIGSGGLTYMSGACCGIYYYSMTYTLPTGGSHSFTAKYSGDTNDATSTSTAFVVPVMQETIPTVLQIALTAPGPYYANTSVAVSAIVQPTAQSATGAYPYPLNFGTVTLKDGSTTVGTIAITNAAGAYTGTGSVKFTSTGARSLTASYSGGYDFMATSLASAIPVTVSAPAATATAISATANPASINQSFNLTAVVTGASSTPTGTVTFTDAGSRKTGSTTLGTATLVNGYASVPVSFAATGSHSITAAYGGDSANAASTSTSLALTVNTNAPSTVSMTATPNPVAIGEPLLVAVTTTGIANGSAVTVNDGTTAIGTGTVSNGQASVTTVLSANGLHYLTASYAGSASVNASKSAPVAVQAGSSAGLTSPGVMTWLYSYDAMGNLTGLVDPIGNTTTLGYDVFNNNTLVTLPASNARTAAPQVSRQFDMRRRLVAVTDPRNNSTSYDYDGVLAAPTATASPDAGASSTAIDANRNITSTTDARGNTALLAYDALSRLTSIAYSDATSTVFEYDGGASPTPNSIGRLSKITDESGTTSYSYDAYGHVASKSVVAGAQVFNLSYGWATSGTAAGKLGSITYPSGSVVNYSYDAQGRLTAITVNPVNSNGIGADTGTTMTVLSGVTYNAANQPTGWNWFGGVPYARSYDSYGHLTSYQLGNPAGTGVSAGLTRTVTYDNAGQVVSYTHSNSAGAQSAFNQSFSYDGLSRVYSASVGSTWYGYDYDLNGNRTDRLIGGSDYTSAYSATSNKVVQEQSPLGTNAYRYDAAGNVTFDGLASYAYSAGGRISSATIGTNVVSYTYNGLGQRVSKAGPGAVVPSGAAYFVYDEAGRLLGEYDSSGAPVYETIYAGATPVAVVKQTGSAASNTLAVSLFNVHADQAGTPRVITRQSDSAIVWRWDLSEPFGATVPDQNPNGLGIFIFNQRFPGQVADAETGLVQNGFRAYDPKSGRYRQADPIGTRGGMNLYGYTNGNPLNAIDPNGLDCVAVNGTVSCNTPAGPISFPQPDGWPATMNDQSPNYHAYNVPVPLNGADANCVMKGVINNPTPGSPSPATPGGTLNNATPTNAQKLFDAVDWVSSFGNDGGGYNNSPVTSYVTNNGKAVVNVTLPGHPLFPGYVIRTTDGSQVSNYGEGTSFLQGPLSQKVGLADQINGVWTGQTQGIVNGCPCKGAK